MYLTEQITTKEEVAIYLAKRAVIMYEDDFNEAYEDYLKIWDEAEKSYEKHPECEKRYCTKCRMIMTAGSMAYVEGYHFDTCL